MKTQKDLPGMPASLYLEQDESGDRRAVVGVSEFACFFCGEPTDESEVCETCTPRACEVLGRVVDSCLASMGDR